MTLRCLYRSALLLLSLLAIEHAGAQAVRPLWRDVSEKSVTATKTRNAGADNRTLVPLSYRTLRLDRSALEIALSAVPAEFSVPMEVSPEIAIPLPDGTNARFNLQESPVMAPELAAKFPEIKTYAGQGIDDPTATIRMDLTPRGFHAIIQSVSGTIYIDPYWRDDDSVYVSYFKRDFASDKPFECLVHGKKMRGERRQGSPHDGSPQQPTGAILRRYRLALACTGEYAIKVCSPNPASVSGALAAMVTSVNRCSAIYERELAIRFQLIPDDDKIIYLNGDTDPYTNDDGFTLLDENQSNIDSVIGSANYDFGHVFSTGGGGVAYLQVICEDGLKALGVTGRSNPVGDPFDVDYVVHEMGHQFGGNHTFNSTVGSCGGGNRNPDTAYETGSGITIMAYAGICGATNLAANSDDYFHVANYEEIDDFTAGSGGSCAAAIATGNTPPTIGGLGAFTIPVSTPFALTANATDPDGDTLTYCWEEFDVGDSQGTAAPSATSTTAPLFRSFAPSLNPTRVFPSLTYILNNANNPPATVGIYATGEIMTTVARPITYRLAVRDNRSGGGGTAWAATTVTTTNPAAGAFAVTAFNTATTVAGGSVQNVTWSKGGSDLAPISCANVKISLSTDGGYTFPTVLAASVPNNGSASVTIPQIATAQARIKVEAVGNIFFDISDSNFTITSNNNAPTLNISSAITVARGTPNATVAAVGTVNDPDGDALSVSVSNLPYRATITPTLVGNSVALSALVECGLVTNLMVRSYPFTLTVTDSHGATVSGTVNLNVTPNAAPVLGSYPVISLPQAGSGTAAPTSVLTDANGNLLPAPYTITPTTLPGGGTIAVDQTTGAITATTTAASTTGAPTAVRVTAIDSCGAAAITSTSISVFAGNPAASYFGGYGLTGGNAAFAFDYDADGILNLMEYALRLDPTKASRAGLPVVIAKDYAGTRYLSMTLTRSAVASDVTYLVEGSSDLSSWSTLASSTGGAVTSGPGFVAEAGSAPNFTAEVRDTVPIDSATTPRFLRLRVTSP